MATCAGADLPDRARRPWVDSPPGKDRRDQGRHNAPEGYARRVGWESGAGGRTNRDMRCSLARRQAEKQDAEVGSPSLYEDDLGPTNGRKGLSPDQLQDALSVMSSGLSSRDSETAMGRQRERLLASRTEAMFDRKDPREETFRSTDPVRAYLRKMGTVSLLSRDGEISIARRIEVGEVRARRAALSTALAVAESRIEVVCDEGPKGRVPPEVWLDGSPSPADVSLSHHGRWLAWGVRSNAPPRQGGIGS